MKEKFNILKGGINARIIGMALLASLSGVAIWRQAIPVDGNSQGKKHFLQNFLAKGYSAKYASQLIENEKKYSPVKREKSEWLQREKDLKSCIEKELSEWISRTNSESAMEVTTREPTREVIGPIIKPCTANL